MGSGAFGSTLGFSGAGSTFGSGNSGTSGTSAGGGNGITLGFSVGSFTGSLSLSGVSGSGSIFGAGSPISSGPVVKSTFGWEASNAFCKPGSSGIAFHFSISFAFLTLSTSFCKEKSTLPSSDAIIWSEYCSTAFL